MTVGLRPYPEYKNSGLPWLPRMPSHWQLRRAKYLLLEWDRRWDKETGTLLSVSQYTGVTKRRLRGGSDDPDTRSSSLFGYKVAEPQDLVVNIMLSWNGSLGVAPCDGLVSPAYCVYRFRSGNPWFFHHLLRSPVYRAEIKRRSRGVVESRLRLYTDDLFRIPLPEPPIEEQSAIARYLDQMDRRINHFIRNRRRLIGVLNEQKQAIINRAVTMGLDPRKGLSDTGRPWFPKLPSHWSAVPLRRVIWQSVDGPHHSPSYVDDGVMFISARNVKADRWSLDNAKFISEDDYREFSKRVIPKEGDVLYTKGGTTGVARVVDLDFPFQVWVHIAVLKLRRSVVDPYYLALALNSTNCYEQSQLYTRGATNQDLGLGRMKDIILPIPPSLDEQREIVQATDQQTAAVRWAITHAQSEIDLIREYRTRLIADVVTGKVDVRHLAPEDAEVEPEDFAPLETDEGIDDEMPGEDDLELVEEE